MAPNRSKWLLEAPKTNRRWSKLGPIGSNWVKLVKLSPNGSKWLQMAQNGSVRLISQLGGDQNGPNLVKWGQIRSKFVKITFKSSKLLQVVPNGSKWI